MHLCEHATIFKLNAWYVMKTKIIYLITFLLFAYCWDANAQIRIEANPSVLNADLLYNTTVQIGEFSFEYSQGGELEKFHADQPVKMTVCFMNVKPSNGAKSVEGELAKFFDWTYIEKINCLRGVQNNHIEERKPGKISVIVESKDEEQLEDHANIGFITNLQPAPKMNQTNKTDDDSVSEYNKVAMVKSLIIAENKEK